MANYTQTTNYSFKKPTVGADTDQWGTHLNETIDGVDSQLKTLADSITSQQLEQLGNVVNVTPVDDQFLRYNGTNWTAETVTIPDVLNDLSNVSGTPSSGDVLTYNGSAWAPASVTSAAITDGSVTNAKLHPSLQTVIGRILVTDDDDSPTDNQILVYSTTDSEWKYADQAGSTLQTLTDVSTTGLSDGDLMTYDGSAGEFVFIDAAAARALLSVDVSGTDNSTPVTLNTNSHDYLTLSSQQITLGPIVLTDDVSGTLPIVNGGTSASTAAGARTALGLVIGTNIQAFDGGLQSISGLTTAADKMIYTTASDTYAVTDLTAAGRAILDDADAAAQRTTLGLGFFATRSIVLDLTVIGGFPATAEFIRYVTYNDDQVLFNKIDLNDQYNFENSLAVSLGGTGGTTASAARTNLGLGALATQDTITESQISDLQTYLTAETNDLSAAVTWANVPDVNITQSSVTQHQAALSITESQISDLQTYLTASSTATLTNKTGNISQWTNDSGYLTAETNNLSTVSGTLGTANGGTGLTAIGTAGQVLRVNSGATALEFADELGGGGSGSSYIEHSSTVSDSLAISAGTNRMYVGNSTFSGSGTMAGYLVISHGHANFTGTVNVDSTGTLRIVG